MDADRSREPLNDLDVDRELQSLLAADPSPEFVARIRTRIASEPMHTKPGRGKSKRSPRHSPSTISNSRSPTGRARTLG